MNISEAEINNLKMNIYALGKCESILWFLFKKSYSCHCLDGRSGRVLLRAEILATSSATVVLFGVCVTFVCDFASRRQDVSISLVVI